MYINNVVAWDCIYYYNVCEHMLIMYNQHTLYVNHNLCRLQLQTPGVFPAYPACIHAGGYLVIKVKDTCGESV